MPAALAVLLLGVLADKGDLSILVLQKRAELDKVEVVGYKEHRVALVIFIEAIPDLLGEELEARRIDVLERAHVRKAAQSQPHLVVTADLEATVGLDLWKDDGAEYVLAAVLVVDEVKVDVLELLDDNVLANEFGHLWGFLGVDVSQTRYVV